MENQTAVEFGNRYNSWLVVGEPSPRKIPSGGTFDYVDCVCICGTERSVRVQALLSDKFPSRSCGCFRLVRLREEMVTHGMTGTEIYSSWQHMKTRCEDKDYRDYGGRGISYTDHWFVFQNFFDEMGGTHFPGAEIDRIDVNGDYCKENCRWVERSVNSHNKRKKKNCTSIYQGVSWSEERQKWVASLTKNKKFFLTKRFNSEYEAALAYDNVSEEIYGDRPNKTVKGEIP